MMNFLQVIQATKDDAIEQERERILRALEADHSKDTTQPHPHGPCYINMDRVIAIVRGDV
jgi:hypothetical protein